MRKPLGKQCRQCICRATGKPPSLSDSHSVEEMAWGKLRMLDGIVEHV